MKKIGLCISIIVIVAQLFGCTSKDAKEIVSALAKVPYVDRTEKEINDWLSAHNIVVVDDTKMGVPYVINGKPTVVLNPNLKEIEKEMNIKIDGSLVNTICVTQYNQLPNTPQPAKYSALFDIKVLNNANLFEVGEIKTISCNMQDPLELRYMTPNLAFGRSQSVIEGSFRSAINIWLKQDIVDMLKSTNNTDGLGQSSNLPPRLPAKTRGVKYAVTEKSGQPAIKAIGFFAE